MEDTGRAAALAMRAPPSAQDIRDATIVKDGDLFLFADLEGNVPLGNTNGFGLYYRDTRFLAAYDLQVHGLRPTILLSSGRWPFLGALVLTNPNFVTDEGTEVSEQTILIRRYRVVRAMRLSESLAFQNFNPFALTMDIALSVDADFADMFDVRGLTTSERRVVSEVAQASISFEHDGCDGVLRTTRVHFEPAPASLGDGAARYRLDLPAHGVQRIAVETEVVLRPRATGSSRRAPHHPPPLPPLTFEAAEVRTSNELFNCVLARERADLRLLAGGDDGSVFLAAGIPWYATLFGRDSLITSLADLWLSPALAKSTLLLLARAQGTHDDPWRDEEPGKILHESRRGELSNAAKVPFGPYFGSVDATPLWIILLAEYYGATADLSLVRALLPNLDAALGWIERYGDLDGDGFVEYRTRSPSGLVNQGWKDSWDGIAHTDGSPPEPPIALVEVQAYVYAAKRRAAALFRAMGEGKRASTLEAEAARLRDHFEAAFWMPSEGFYCIALDGKKRQVTTIASNAGQALSCGIVGPERAARVAERLMSEDLFSGWGIRTLSTREVRYNPTGYHVGSVWPHDNAIIAQGLKRYRREAQVVDIASGLFDAAQHFPSFRMPELFCGFARSAFGVPVRYPIACSPQAWAAAAWSMILQALLGIRADAAALELSVVRPTLPSWLRWVEIDRLRVGRAEVDLRYERVGGRTVVDVVAMRGGARVTLAGRWGGDGKD